MRPYLVTASRVENLKSKFTKEMQESEEYHTKMSFRAVVGTDVFFPQTDLLQAALDHD